jgi:hypothetical protein
MWKRVASVIAITAMLCGIGTARAQDADTSDLSSPDTMSVSIAGCWQGIVFNTAFCSSQMCLFTLFFTQKGSSISKHGSTYDIEYDQRAPLMNVISGKSSSAKQFPVKFHGVAFKGCKIHFEANFLTPTKMTGKFQFSGPCTEQQYTNGEFTVNFLGATCP